MSAQYILPTDAYGHNAIPNSEYEGLSVTYNGQTHELRYEGAVFEDTAPRLVDFDGDGVEEVLTVLSGFNDGARILVIGVDDDGLSPVAWTPPIGHRNRWHAIAGAADFDGDGEIEVAYVDRPHLAKILRFTEFSKMFDDWIVMPMGEVAGLSNHRLGAPMIEGGVRDCDGPEVITADGNWTRIMATRFDPETGDYVSRDIGTYTGPDSLRAATEAC